MAPGASTVDFRFMLAQASQADEEGGIDMEFEAGGTDASRHGKPSRTLHQHKKKHGRQQHESARGEQRQQRERGREEEGREERSEGAESSGAEYEFTAWEERVMEVVMEAMRMAGLALAMRAMATICLGAQPLFWPFLPCKAHGMQPFGFSRCAGTSMPCCSPPLVAVRLRNSA
jgi:hypothetical protein